MYRKDSETKTVRFFYNREQLFNDVSLMSNFMAKNLATKDGNSLTDEFAISDDEKDLFGVCVQQSLPDIYEAMTKITSGVSSAFEDDYLDDSIVKEYPVESAPMPESPDLYAGASEPGGKYKEDEVYYVTPRYNRVYLTEEPETTWSSGETYYEKTPEHFVLFILQDNAAYNENVLTLVDASLYNVIKYGVLKEFYSTVLQADFFKVCTERFLGELFKLKSRLFQLKKKSVVSSLT